MIEIEIAIQRRLENIILLCFQSFTAISNRPPLSIRTAQKAKSALSVTSARTLLLTKQSSDCQISVSQPLPNCQKKMTTEWACRICVRPSKPPASTAEAALILGLLPPG